MNGIHYFDETLAIRAEQKATGASVHSVRNITTCYSWYIKHGPVDKAIAYEKWLLRFLATGNHDKNDFNFE